METDAGKAHPYNESDPQLEDGATKPHTNQFMRQYNTQLKLQKVRPITLHYIAIQMMCCRVISPSFYFFAVLVV